MKTRIIYTKIWQDSFFSSLSPEEKLVFIYYITNEQVNILHFYECTDRKVLFDTGISLNNLEKLKLKLISNNKIYFHKDYVFLTNASRYETYTGEKNEEAKRKILSLLSKDVLDWYNNVLDRGMDRGMDTRPIPSINHNTEIISNKLVKERGYRREDLTDEVLQEIADKYKVPVIFVESKLDDMDNWLKAKGKKYRDYKHALMNWVKSDALKIMQKERQQFNKFKVTKL